MRLRAGPFLDASQTFLKQLTESGIKRDLLPDGFEPAHLSSFVKLLVHCTRHRNFSEETLIEGAGACLAMFLLCHMPDASHVARQNQHRLRLGVYGYFNPFQAITFALDASSPKSVLIEALSYAERERKGAGPISATITAFKDALLLSHPDWQIKDFFETEVLLTHSSYGEITFDLHPWIKLGDSGELTSSHFETLWPRLPGTLRRVDFNAMLQSVMPRWVGPDTFRGPESQAIHTLEWLPGKDARLRVGFVAPMAKHVRWITKSDIALWSRDEHFQPPQLLTLALHHLVERSNNMTMRRWTEACELFHWGDGFDAARFMLPSVWHMAAKAMGGHCYLSVPHRDALLVSKHQLALRNETQALHERAPHRLCTTLFETDGTEIATVNDR